MHIDDQDLYHGAALAQIARHSAFTAINVLKLDGVRSRSAFGVNDDIAVYLKYASTPTAAYSEYQFTFTEDHIADLKSLRKKRDRCFVVLVCVEGQQICCLPFAEFFELRKLRRKALGYAEEALTLLATLPKRKHFRVYVNRPGRRGSMLCDPILVPQNAFPGRLFE